MGSLATISVVLVIGHLTLGPFVETQKDRDLVAKLNAPHPVMDVIQTNKCENCVIGKPFKWTVKQIVCRRAMEKIGIGWRKSLDGSFGWMTTNEREWFGLGNYIGVKVKCELAPDGFRKNNFDMEYEDQVDIKDVATRHSRK